MFIKYETQKYDYNLIFDKYHDVSVILHGPILFDFQSKQRNCVYEDEVHEYNEAVEIVWLADVAALNIAPIYNYDYCPDQWWR